MEGTPEDTPRETVRDQVPWQEDSAEYRRCSHVEYEGSDETGGDPCQQLEIEPNLFVDVQFGDQEGQDGRGDLQVRRGICFARLGPNRGPKSERVALEHDELGECEARKATVSRDGAKEEHGDQCFPILLLSQ